MRPYINTVFIVGNLGAPAKRMFTKNSKPYCFFSVAVMRDWAPGGAKPSSDWIQCVSYMPKVVDQLCDGRAKGRTVMVSGSLQSYQKNTTGSTKVTIMQLVAKNVNIVPPIDTIDDPAPYSDGDGVEEASHASDDEVPF